MKRFGRWTVGLGGVIAGLLLTMVVFANDNEGIIVQSEIVARTGGVGSLPGALLRDGTICLTPTTKSLQCRPLAKLSDAIPRNFVTQPHFFDGIYDLDGNGEPEIFLDYWPTSDEPSCPAKEKEPGGNCNSISLLLFRKSEHGYREYAQLHAPTEGYLPGAWFIQEGSLRKAIFRTRYGGSSGAGLFYLNSNKPELELIAQDLVEEPVIVDFIGDGNAEIFAIERGYDRSARQGVVLLHWKDNAYRIWWPNWEAPPYVIHARMAKVGGNKRNEILAVLDPAVAPREEVGSRTQGISGRRERGIWKLADGVWKLVDKTRIPGLYDSESMLGQPDFWHIRSNNQGADIVLDHGKTVCRYKEGKIACEP